MTLVNIGYNNMVSCEHIIAVIGSDTAPAKRLLGEAKESGRIIDATCGKKTQAVIVTDSDHVILSAIQAETVANRLDNNDSSIDDEEEEND